MYLKLRAPGVATWLLLYFRLKHDMWCRPVGCRQCTIYQDTPLPHTVQYQDSVTVTTTITQYYIRTLTYFWQGINLKINNMDINLSTFVILNIQVPDETDAKHPILPGHHLQTLCALWLYRPFCFLSRLTTRWTAKADCSELVLITPALSWKYQTLW